MGPRARGVIRDALGICGFRWRALSPGSRLAGSRPGIPSQKVLAHLPEGLFVRQGRHVLKSEESVVARLFDETEKEGVVDLAVEEFPPSGNSCRMEVADERDVFGDGGGKVSLHDLHVVDIIEESQERTVDPPDNLKPFC